MKKTKKKWFSHLKGIMRSKLGMTYVELLTALALLSLIVVTFTPMLLQSYDWIYYAGTKTEEVYDSKTEIEEGLATRFSEDEVTLRNVRLRASENGEDFFLAVEFNARRVVSSLKKGLETIFLGSRAAVTVSPTTSVLYDNKNIHDIQITTEGLVFDEVIDGTRDLLRENQRNMRAGGKGVVQVQVIVPDISAEIPDKYKNLNRQAKVEIKEFNAESGLLTVTISPGSEPTEIDFTHSPLKVKVRYVGNRNKIQETSAYVAIEPPSIIMAGQTSGAVDYYTTAGVKADEGNYSLTIQGRTLTTYSTGSIKSAPDDKTIINTVNYVVPKVKDGSSEKDNEYLNPYFVLAGSNSAVYRMYDFKKEGSISDALNNTTATEVIDKAISLDDGTKAYPAFWGGEVSDEYYFFTKEDSQGYVGGESKDGTAKSDYNSGTKYNKYDSKLRYMMAYSGFNSGYYYQYFANRRISYILTERGKYSYRLAGQVGSVSDYNNYGAIWEESNYYAGGGSALRFDDSYFPGTPHVIAFVDGYRTWKTNREGRRELAQDHYDKVYSGVVYFEDKNKYDQGDCTAGKNDHKYDGDHFDNTFAFVRIKSLISYNPFIDTANNTPFYQNKLNKGDFWYWCDGDDEYGVDTSVAGDRVKPNTHLDDHCDGDLYQTDRAENVNITSAVYLPGAASDGSGQMIYFGTVPAYSFLMQSCDLGNNSDIKGKARGVYTFNCYNVIESRMTGYIIAGTDGNQTTVYRSYAPESNDPQVVSDRLNTAISEQIRSSTMVPEQAASAFYTNTNDTVYKYVDNDLAFTLGYCSRWRMTIGDVTSRDGTSEETKSYEKYYKASNKDATYGAANTDLGVGNINKQGANNLYYNVWFPGEMYNLTKTATLDNVTVAVGYAVSGSTFMKQSTVSGCGDYYGTALGSVYNDGVLAAYSPNTAQVQVTSNDGYVKENDNYTPFTNLLYYKSPTFTNETLHSRANIRFTQVGLYTVGDNYYAVYSDNNGNVYRSKVATSGTLAGAISSTSTSANGGMEKLTAFSGNGEVKTITIHDTIMIVTYEDSSKDKILTRDNTSIDFTFSKAASFEHGLGTVNAVKSISGYIYLAGDKKVGAVTPAALTSESLEIVTADTGKGSVTTTKENAMLVVHTATDIYDMDGMAGRDDN